jgi:serine/threonine protein kinase
MELDHLNIVKCHEIYKDDYRWYIVNEYCNYGTLVDIIKDFKILTPPNKELYCHKYLSQLKDAINYLHKNGILHRDLKPANILINKDKCTEVQTVKLADFGFSRYFEYKPQISSGYDDMVSTICGSPIYMAPELVLGYKYNIKADLWSFGVIMYELLYGHNPYNFPKNIVELGQLMKTKRISFPQIYSEQCIDLMTRLLKVNAEKRITWEEFFEHQWFTLETVDENEDTKSEHVSQLSSGRLSEEIFKFDECTFDDCTIDESINEVNSSSIESTVTVNNNINVKDVVRRENMQSTFANYDVDKDDYLVCSDVGSTTVMISKSKIQPTEKKVHVIEKEQQIRRTFQMLKEKGRSASDAARDLEKSPFSSVDVDNDLRKKGGFGTVFSDLIENSIDVYYPSVDENYIVIKDRDSEMEKEYKKKKAKEIKKCKVSVGESVMRILSDSVGYAWTFSRSYGSGGI